MLFVSSLREVRGLGASKEALTVRDPNHFRITVYTLDYTWSLMYRIPGKYKAIAISKSLGA